MEKSNKSNLRMTAFVAIVMACIQLWMVVPPEVRGEEPSFGALSIWEYAPIDIDSLAWAPVQKPIYWDKSTGQPGEARRSLLEILKSRSEKGTLTVVEFMSSGCQYCGHVAGGLQVAGLDTILFSVGVQDEEKEISSMRKGYTKYEPLYIMGNGRSLYHELYRRTHGQDITDEPVPVTFVFEGTGATATLIAFSRGGGLAGGQLGPNIRKYLAFRDKQGPFKVTVPASEGYHITSDTPSQINEQTNLYEFTVEKDGDFSFRAEAKNGYRFTKDFQLSADGQPILPQNGVYTIPHLQKNTDIQVTGSAKAVCQVALPNKSLQGFRVQPQNMPLTEDAVYQVLEGEPFSFSVEIISQLYEQSDDFGVSYSDAAGSKIPLTANQGIYTISRIQGNVQVEVTGVVKRSDMTPQKNRLTVNGSSVTVQLSLDTTEETLNNQCVLAAFSENGALLQCVIKTRAELEADGFSLSFKNMPEGTVCCKFIEVKDWQLRGELLSQSVNVSS